MNQGLFGKDRKKKIAVAFSILVGVLFLIEIVAIPFSSQSPVGATGTLQDFSVKFSTTWIFDTPLTNDEKSYLITNGRTLATYNYTDSPGFFELEKIINQLSGQVVMEREKSDKVSLALTSSRGTMTVENLTTQNIFSGLCDVLNQPPLDCSSIE